VPVVYSEEQAKKEISALESRSPKKPTLMCTLRVPGQHQGGTKERGGVLSKESRDRFGIWTKVPIVQGTKNTEKSHFPQSGKNTVTKFIRNVKLVTKNVGNGGDRTGSK